MFSDYNTPTKHTHTRHSHTLRSGMLNLLLVDRTLVRVVAMFILSHVCWQVLSPGAEINQNSVMAVRVLYSPALSQQEFAKKKKKYMQSTVTQFCTLIPQSLSVPKELSIFQLWTVFLISSFHMQ